MTSSLTESSLRTQIGIMAEQLNMGGLSIQEQHAPNGSGMGGRPTYIPPHMRGVAQPPPSNMDGAGPMMNGGMDRGVWGGPPAGGPPA